MSNKKTIDREKVYAAAKLIADSVYSRKCDENGCATCNNNGDCTPVEMAYQIVGAGYEVADNKPMEINHDAGNVETLAKTIAVSRGFGCQDGDSCAKCACRIVECIPLSIAEVLEKAGYTKKESA